jgi:hypothetical protein
VSGSYFKDFVFSLSDIGFGRVMSPEAKEYSVTNDGKLITTIVD